MAHEGHVGGVGRCIGLFGFRTHHYSSSDDNRHNKPAWKQFLETIFFIFILFFGIVGCFLRINENHTPKYALEGEYSAYYTYLVDNRNYFSNSDNLISGLEYFYQKTNIQIVVITSNEDLSDSKAVSEYYQMFDDEAHILIIIPKTGNIIYYAIGDLADTVFGDKDMTNLLNTTVRNSKNGEVWEKYLKKSADLFE